MAEGRVLPGCWVTTGEWCPFKIHVPSASAGRERVAVAQEAAERRRKIICSLSGAVFYLCDVLEKTEPFCGVQQHQESLSQCFREALPPLGLHHVTLPIQFGKPI